MFVLCFSATYLARGAIDNFGTKLAPASRKKHFADIQLVSFLTYCSLKWEGLSIPPHM